VLLSGNNARGIYSVKYYKGKFDAYQRTYVITVKDTKRLSYRYFLYDLLLRLELLRRQSIGATTKYLTASIIKNLGLTLPPLSEQLMISSVLWACDEKIAALEQETALLGELFHAMLDELMTGNRSAVPLIDREE
jgi:type I restriction enzyme S subunit